jgi:predicted lactoylglutathione lyase
MRQKMNLITLGVRDFERSLTFYEKGLGWKKSSSSMDTLALFQLGGIVLSLYPRTELAADATVVDQPTGFSGITLSLNTKTVEEVDEVLQEAVRAGGKLVKPGQKVFWGGYSGYFSDPDGHLFEVAYNPFWELDDKDDVVLGD